MVCLCVLLCIIVPLAEQKGKQPLPSEKSSLVMFAVAKSDLIPRTLERIALFARVAAALDYI
jgi:hypothetical protein